MSKQLDEVRKSMQAMELEFNKVRITKERAN